MPRVLGKGDETSVHLPLAKLYPGVCCSASAYCALTSFEISSLFLAYSRLHIKFRDDRYDHHSRCHTPVEPPWPLVVQRDLVRHLREQCSVVLREVRAQSKGYGERVTLARNLSSGERLSVDLPITQTLGFWKAFRAFRWLKFNFRPRIAACIHAVDADVTMSQKF